MLKNLIIFSLSVVAIHAFGEFTILSTHKSMAFKGKEALESEDVGEVLYSALGNPVSGNVQWPGLQIADPFHLPKQAVIVTISGVDHSKISDTGKTYKLHGNTLEQSVNGAISRFEADGEPVCVFSFEQFEDGKQSFKNIFGDVKIPPIAKTKHLNANLHKSDKQCLESLAYFSAIADNLPNLKTPCKFMDIGLFFDDIAKLHGKEGLSEALDLASTAVKKLNIALQKSSNNDALVVVAVNKASNNSRSKREASPDDAKTRYNLAEYYNEDYPVIFNIILWFMVVFGFALLAICYAIGSMDPGRDSIIYRMTSTRMKKDN